MNKNQVMTYFINAGPVQGISLIIFLNNSKSANRMHGVTDGQSI